MEQDQFLQRKKLVQAHQLGELQKDYTIRFGKQIAQWGVPGLIALIIFFVRYAGSDITAAIIAIIVVLAFYSTVLGRPLYSLRGLHVYVYTDGLIYWHRNRNKRRAVRWEQIRRVYRQGSALTIAVKNEPSFSLTSFIDRQRELFATIKRQVDSHRSSGTELEFSELINPDIIVPAWRMKMLNQASDPGVPIGKKGRVYFITRSREVLFQADKQDVKAKWPWWEFGGGVRLTVDGKVYRIYFNRPSHDITGTDWSALEDELSYKGSHYLDDDKTDIDWSGVAGLDIIPPEIRALVLPLVFHGAYKDIKKIRRNAKALREYLGTEASPPPRPSRT